MDSRNQEESDWKGVKNYSILDYRPVLIINFAEKNDVELPPLQIMHGNQFNLTALSQLCSKESKISPVFSTFLTAFGYGEPSPSFHPRSTLVPRLTRVPRTELM